MYELNGEHILTALSSVPGRAVSIPLTTLQEESFQDGLATFLEQASTEYITQFAAITWKAAAKLPEIRDTSDPSLISGLFMTIIEACGAEMNVPKLRKRVRDTVSFDNARKPWRRSPFYLVLRVAIQRYLYDRMGAQLGGYYYKTTMLLFLAQLLEDVLKCLPLEEVFHLRQKLGRRLAKLESDAYNTGKVVKDTHSDIMQSLRNVFETTLATTGGYLKRIWRNHKQSRERFVPVLRRHAHNLEFTLRMPNSGKTLSAILSQGFSDPRSQQRAPSQLLELHEQSVSAVKPYRKALSQHISLAKYHENIIVPAKRSMHHEQPRSIELGRIIRAYVEKITNSNKEYPNQTSQMLLHLMELWVLMDKDIVTFYPLLKEYHPGFDADILDPIQLLTLAEMERAQAVRNYLAIRYRSRSNMQSKTIFDDPADDCFAVQYFESVDDQDELSQLREEIENKADCEYAAKEQEWEEQSRIYEETISRRNEKECIYDTSTARDGTTYSKHRKPCEWHQLHHEAKNMRIRIFEHPLPKFEPAAKAALFELQCPEDLVAYRDATWLILSNLCHQPVEPLERISLIREYSQLRPYINDIDCQVTLGSYKKAHLECHYSDWTFPVARDDVLRTCGLKPKYCDSLGMAWTGGYKKASFWHHFPVKLPPGSPFLPLELTYATWPTSNEVQASQARCPQGISVYEFMAWQGLLIGTHSRWLDLLRELGSTNLNFSSLSTWALVLRLVLQHGPSVASDQLYTDPHSVLLDETFCSKLFRQVQYRLDAIVRNWREPVQMDMLVTILLKVVSLAPTVTIREQGLELLQHARSVTGQWRVELQSIVTEDPKMVQSAVWASLLCKRTLHVYPDLPFDTKSLRHYVDASISLQYNLSGSWDSMPYDVRNAIVSDILFAYDRREYLKQAILSDPHMFIDAVGSLWQIPKDYYPKASGIEVFPDTWWILLTLESPTQQHSYSVHYNYVYGTLLVDGKEMSTLPLEYRRHPTFNHIFGTRNPTVFPSSLRGMSFALSETVKNGHYIHLGFRKGQMIVRAAYQGRLLEFIPREVFGTDQGGLDVPRPLIDECYHWLDVCEGHVEVRQKDAWAASKPGNWWFLWSPAGFYRAVRRLNDYSETTLVEPSSDLARDITRVFINFEYPSQIMVFASTGRDGSVTAELKRLELSFYINDRGFLQSRRLGAIITQNQDAGTWYGLRSKIVVQSIANRHQKSILIPWGTLRVRKDDCHVSAEIEMGRGIYLKYGVNEVLGRIECSPEPKLLYMKALLHAYTSHVFYDPLTRRTGTDEALYLLNTGAYQPWKPFSDEESKTLEHIAGLSPQRGYYPVDAKSMETAVWDSAYTIHMQDDRFWPAATAILQKSSDLCRFYHDQSAQPQIEMLGPNPHLAARAIQRSHCPQSRVKDTVYCARDLRSSSIGHSNVIGICKLLLEWRPTLSTDATLLSLLHDAPIIGGYDKLYRKCLLTDHLAVDIRAEWGALTQKSLQCDVRDRHSLMFLFGTMAFSEGAESNVELLRILISMAMLPEIRALRAPEHAAYFHFRADGAPPPSYLVSLMAKAKKPFVDTGFKKRSLLVKAEVLHEPNIEKSSEALARSILKQWPAPEIDARQLLSIDPAYLDADKALEDIAPEWTRFAHNHELSLYLEQVQAILSQLADQDAKPQSRIVTTENKVSVTAPVYSTRERSCDDPTLSRLLQRDITHHKVLGISSVSTPAGKPHNGVLTATSGNMAPRPIDVHDRTSNLQARRVTIGPRFATPQSAEIGKLKAIVASFKDTSSFVQCRYANELEVSIDALQVHIANRKNSAYTTYPQLTTEDIQPARECMVAAFEHIRNTLFTSDPQVKWLQKADVGPKLTIVELLTELRAISGTNFGKGAKEAVVGFGLAVSKYQRLLRIQDAQRRKKQQQEREERANEGHTNWSPLTYPDWLLLEIDGDVLLREEQIQVALATIAPDAGENSVLQLLMGKGKTSCILREYPKHGI
jgi:hypothetical protein